MKFKLGIKGIVIGIKFTFGLFRSRKNAARTQQKSQRHNEQIILTPNKNTDIDTFFSEP